MWKEEFLPRWARELDSSPHNDFLLVALNLLANPPIAVMLEAHALPSFTCALRSVIEIGSNTHRLVQIHRPRACPGGSISMESM